MHSIPITDALRQKRRPTKAGHQALKNQQAVTTEARGLGIQDVPTTSGRGPACAEPRASGRLGHPRKKTADILASDVTGGCSQRLQAATPSQELARPPRGTRQTQQSNRRPKAGGESSEEDACTSDSSPSKKPRRKLAAAERPAMRSTRAKAALSFDADDARNTSEPGSGAPPGPKTPDTDASAGEAAEEPAAGKRGRGQEKTGPKQNRVSEPRTRTAKAKLERQLRPRHAGQAAGPTTPVKAPITPSPAQPRSRCKQQPATAKAARRVALQQCEVDGTTFRVGDCAYVICDTDFEDDGEVLEVCEVCNKAEKRRGQKVIHLLECDRCLRGFHLDCLKPPLPAVPKGDWMCPLCEAGGASVPTEGGAGPSGGQQRRKLTHRQKFLAGQLDLARIEALWREGKNTFFRGRWYYRPEDTIVGRQEHHTAREVFLTEGVDDNDADALLAPVVVCAPACLREHPGDDVFVCDHMYHAGYEVFKALDDVEDGDAAIISDDGSDADEGDDTFKPLRTGRGGGDGRRRCLQGGQEWASGRRKETVGLGAASIPASVRARDRTPLETARAALALTASPGPMPCREAERAEISRFIEEAVAAGERCLGQCLYVAGVPGTGKTATVHEVVRQLQQRTGDGELPAFRFVEINALRLSSPQHAYVHLYLALTGKHASPATAAEQLEAMFSGAGSAPKRVTVVLVDEMDLLITKKQQVLYNLCEWPTRAGARLAVIGIANTLDLPERLAPRVASRLGGRRVVFQPYKRDQLKRIVEQRLKDAGVAHVFQDNAISYAAGKVAAVSGDARRALELCRKAAEVAEEEQAAGVPSPGTPPQRPSADAASAAAAAAAAAVTAAAAAKEAEHRRAGVVVFGHVDVAIRDMFRAAHMQLLGNACRLEKILLAALVLDNRATGRSDAVLRGVHARMQSLCAARQEPEPYCGDVISAAVRLGAKRLVLAGPGAHRLSMRLALNVSTDDVVTVLKSDTSIPWMAQLNL